MILIIITGVLLIFSYYYSSFFARTDHITDISRDATYSGYIYNEKGIKLVSDFYINDNFNCFAVLYVGYDFNEILVIELKDFYLKNGIGVIITYANAFGKSFGGVKVDDHTLHSDLKLWINYLKKRFGPNVKLILHGFSYTALSCYLLEDDRCILAVSCDNTYLHPPYIYSPLKKRTTKFLPKKKFRINLSETDKPIFISSDKKFSGDALKLHSLTKKQGLYIYENFNSKDYLLHLKEFLIRHLKPPEE